MKKKLTLVAALFLSVYSNAQVGVNTATPAATFDVVAKANATTAEGIIAPRLTGLEIKTATSNSLYTAAQSGAIVYATSAQPVSPATPASANVNALGYYYWDGTLWQKFDINLYLHDGTLSTNRTVSMSDKTLSFNPGATQVVNQFSVDDSTFSIDALNNRVGIGTATPSSLLQVNGTITANRIQGPSDSRFKKNITPIENALKKVLSLGGYTYDWKDTSEFPNQSLGNGHDMGVIAQEVEKVFPEAVTTNKDGYKAVNYQALIPALIEAIKAQQVQINALQIQVNKLTK